MPSAAWFKRPVLATLALDAALAEAVLAMRNEDIEPLLIKGPAIAAWLYDEPAQRTYGDVDLLVGARDVARARAVLESLGYRDGPSGFRAEELSPHAATYVRPGAAIDLHWQLNLLSTNRAYELLAGGGGQVTVAGVDVTVPAPPALALIIALHASQHRDSEVPALADLELAIERAGTRTWTKAAELAAEAGAASALRSGLELAGGGRELADRLGLPPVPAAIRLRSHEPFATARADAFRVAGGHGHRVRLLFSSIFPSPAFMRHFEPLARRGPLGLAAAYALRIPRLIALGLRTAYLYARAAIASRE
jgi:hypothetical protein